MARKNHLKIMFLFLGLLIGLVLVLKNASLIDNFNFEKPNDVKIENTLDEVSEN